MAGGMAFGGPQQPTPRELPAHARCAGYSWRPTLLLRVLLHRSSLDRQLAEGIDPEQTGALSLRARQLQGMRLRRSLASSLTRDIVMTEGRPSRYDTALPINREEVIRARPLLLQLVERLRGTGSLSPRGVAMIRWMLTDGSSPIFAPGWSRAKSAPRALERHAQNVLAVFDGKTPDLPPGNRPRR